MFTDQMKNNQLISEAINLFMLRIDVELSDHEHDERNVTKKANKPLMEKRRRARINRCLFEMKQMLVDSITTGSPGQSKWEKADILEMSVAYMRQLQKQTLQTGIEDPLGSSQFIEGFSECLKEVEKFNAANTLPSAVQEHNARLSDHLTVRLQTLVENPRPKLRSSFEDRSAQQPSSAAADVVYSLTHSQTSPSSSSSAATSPKSSPGGNDEPSTRLPTKRRRKNAAQPDRRIAIPLPSTLSLPHPQHNRSDQVNMIGANHSVAHILPLSVDQCVLGEFLNCMRPLGMKHSQTQPLIWPSTIDLVNACNDLGTLNNRWMHTLWRPF